MGLGLGLGLGMSRPKPLGAGSAVLAVVMTAPSNGATLVEDVATTLTCAISETGATAEFFVNGASIGMGTVAGTTGSISWTPADPGPYTIFVRAVKGAETADSAPIGVTVQIPFTPANITSVGKYFCCAPIWA